MGEVIRLTQVDGKLPNLALMTISRHHRDRGDEVHFTKQVERGMFEPAYDRVYGSAIFSSSAGRVARLRTAFPGAVVGGTWDPGNPVTVEQTLDIDDGAYDYSIYPGFDSSMGFTARGCRLKCSFCVVPKKEGKPRFSRTISQIWRGGSLPKHIHLLDNDFFGQPRSDWEARLDEVRQGGFKVSFTQGINIRMIDDTSAAALSTIPYYDDSFTKRRLYTAWDALPDEARFLRGVETLRAHGIPPTHLLVYMLVGYDRRETWERVLYRLNKMAALGIRPYPMVYGDKGRGLPDGGTNMRLGNRTLGEFQRWVIRKAYNFVPFEEYDGNAKGRLREPLPQLFDDD